jgi:RimJ/RimL family protein N-acetyltransferase
MGSEPLTNAPVVRGPDPLEGAPVLWWLSGTLAVLRWRTIVARRLLWKPTWAIGGKAALFAFVVWPGLLITELARHSPAGQVALAVIGGILIAVWSTSGQLLRQTRLAPAAIHPVSTERLVLRPPCTRDSRAYAASLDGAMMAANGWPESMRRWSITIMRHADRVPLRNMTVIADRVTDELVGWISLSNVDRAGGSCELGWTMAPHARGKGYGTEAIRAALDSIHRHVVRRVVIGTKEDNLPVRRVMERIGAQQIRTGLHTLPNGQTVPTVWYVCDAPLPSDRAVLSLHHTG